MLPVLEALNGSLDGWPGPTSPLSSVDHPLATLTMPPAHLLLPRVTPPPTSCSTSQVLVELSTALVIRDYQRFYSTDINSFRPTYIAWDDGSLVTPALITDLRGSSVDLLFTAALAMLFLRNIVVAIDYLRRGRMKNKTLYYLLLASQALAPASFIPSLVSTFNRDISCTLTVLLSSTVGSLALALLLSGIMGIKTYKCMNDSRIVAGIIAILELSHIVFVILDALTMRGIRRLTGGCLRANDLRFTRISIAIHMSTCCFMTVCFVYTYIKYRRTPGARGRISLRMSMEEPLNGEGLGDTVEKNGNSHDLRSFRNSVSSAALALNNTTPGPPVFRRSSELRPDDCRSHAHKSTSSSFSRLSRLLSSVAILRRVMRDELLYSCVITAVFTLALVLTFTGVDVKNGLSIMNWITSTWGLISVFVIHSCGRVIRRHERDAIMRYAASRPTLNSFLGAPRVDYARETNPMPSANSPNRRPPSLLQTVEFTSPFSEDHLSPQIPRSSSQFTPSPRSSNLPSPLEVTDSRNLVVFPSSPLESSYQLASGRASPATTHESSSSQENPVLELASRAR